MPQDPSEVQSTNHQKGHRGTLRADLTIYYRYYPSRWGQRPNLDHIDDEGPWWIWSCCGQPHDATECLWHERWRNMLSK